MGQKLSLGVFGMLKCIANLAYKILKIKLAFQDGVTKVNDTKSRAKFLLVAFSLVFNPIFQLSGTKCGYSLTYW